MSTRRYDAPHFVTVATITFAVVLISSLFGILTRPVGFLASFWPANAVLLGLFVRCPSFSSPPGWIAATVAYFAADLMTGGHIVLTAWLTAANLAGVATGVALFRLVSEDDRRLRRPLSVLFLFGFLTAAAAAAAVVGAGAAPIYFGKDVVTGVAFWFTTELANGIIVLPVILTAPRPSMELVRLRRPKDAFGLLLRAAPAITLLVSILIGFFVGGPGALAFPAPALLWCALTYPLFPTVVLTMLVSIWHLVAVSLGFFTPEIAHLDAPTMSGRLGIMLLALGPLTVASINAARSDLLKRLEILATYDTLTGALTRAAFLQRGSELLVGIHSSCVVLMLDIDRFKEINDTYGHAAGDKVLVSLSKVARQSLRDRDLFGRVGGEEFAAILPETSIDEAMHVAERLRGNIERMHIALERAVALKITASIGITHQLEPGPALLDRLLSTADQALYQAKAAGRNRVVNAASMA